MKDLKRTRTKNMEEWSHTASPTPSTKDLKGMVFCLNIFNAGPLKSYLNCVFSVWWDINIQGYGNMEFHYSPLAVPILHCLTTTTVCAGQTINIGLVLNLKKFHKNLTNSDALFKATAKIISLLMKHVRTSKSREEQQLLIANYLLPEHFQVGHVDITSDNSLINTIVR